MQAGIAAPLDDHRTLTGGGAMDFTNWPIWPRPPSFRPAVKAGFCYHYRLFMLPTLKRFALVIILAAVGVSMAAQSPPLSTPENRVAKGNTGLHTEKPTTSEEDNAYARDVTVLVNQGNPRDTKDDATEAKENVAIERKLVILTALLVIAGFLTCGVIAWQSWETRKAAEAARENIEIIKAKERARISISPKDLSPPKDHGETASISYRIQFSGATQPVGVYAKIEACATLVDFPRVEIIEDIQDFPVVAGSQLSEDSILISHAIGNASMVDKIKSGEATVIFHGSIFYRDIFQSETDRPHETKFRFKWKGCQFPIMPCEWKKDGGKDENYQT